MFKILVTGGSGFIGANVLNYYLEKGFDILNIDSKVPLNNTHNKYWKKIDITDYNILEQTIKIFNPDFIIHLAARTDLNGKAIEDYTSNTYGTKNILRIANELPSLKRVIFTSSMLVCKPGYIPKHSADYAPSTMYGESKVKMEQMIKEKDTMYEWSIVRPTSIWGPGFGVPYRNFFDMVLKNRYFHIGKQSCTKTYGYIGNVVYQIDSILNCPSENFNKQVFYLGDYQPINIKEWANEIGNEIGIKIKTIPFPIIKLAAFGGDILKTIGINFPITSFRLKNMTTDNILNLSNTKEIAPNLPFSRIDGIIKTLNWLKNSE